MKTSRVLCATTALVALAAVTGCRSSSSASTTHASTGSIPNVRIMVGGIDKVIYLPAKLTEQLGYFTDAGVDVQLLSEPSGPSAENVLIAGQVEGVVGFYDHAVALQTEGKCLESVVQMSKAPGEAEVVPADSTITDAAGFAGKRLGVTSPGSSTDFLTQALAVRAGIPAGGHTPVKAGAGAPFIASLSNHQIDGGMDHRPDPRPARGQRQGQGAARHAHSGGLAGCARGSVPVQLALDCGYVESNGATVQKLADAMVKTLQWMDTHTAQEIAAKMPADDAGGDAALYAKAVGDTKPMFTNDGVMPAEGPATVLRVLGSFNPNVKGKESSIDPSKNFMTTFVDQAKRG